MVTDLAQFLPENVQKRHRSKISHRATEKM